jgi:thiosulfate/3-mercaptopyruvate sulfurtransferase
MTFQTLISTTELQHAIDNAAPGALLLLDCSFALTDLRAGQRAYDAGHLPGARYVHLEDTLSTLKTGTNGRRARRCRWHAAVRSSR